jgi:hypothetical protein
LLGLWGLPLELIEAVAYHHTPSRVAHEDIEILAAVHVADAMVENGVDRPAALRREWLDGDFAAQARVARLLQSWEIDTEALIAF